MASGATDKKTRPCLKVLIYFFGRSNVESFSSAASIPARVTVYTTSSHVKLEFNTSLDARHVRRLADESHCDLRFTPAYARIFKSTEKQTQPWCKEGLTCSGSDIAVARSIGRQRLYGNAGIRRGRAFGNRRPVSTTGPFHEMPSVRLHEAARMEVVG